MVVLSRLKKRRAGSIVEGEREERLAVSADPRIGSELLGYRIEAIIGRGGMSAVYRARHLSLDRNVALKILAADLAADERFRERFLRESKLAASIEHPHIVPVYDAGKVDGSLYIAMRYVEGTDLKALLRRSGALEPARALTILAQLAEALKAAHEHGLVHRDVKPSNVLIDAEGSVYLTDFGLTKSVSDRSALTATGQIIGTVDYVAPEQIEGKPVDLRADIYSLGCLLYESLTGEVPFPRDSELAALWAHVQERPPKASARRPALPKEIDGVIAKAMAKAPSGRFASCGQLVEAARAALPPPEPPVAPSRRRLVLGIAAVLASAAALGAALWLGRGTDESANEPTLAPEVDSIQRIDPETNELVATIEPGSNPSDLAVGQGAVWVVNVSDRTVSRIDPDSKSVRTAPAGGDPRSVAAGEGAVWVLSPRDAALARIDPNTLSTLGTTAVVQRTGQLAYGGFGAWALAVGEGSVWVGGTTINRINPKGVVLEAIPDSYLAISIAFGHGSVWIRNGAFEPGGGIWRVDPATNRVTAKVPLSFYPFGLAVGEGGAWTAHSETDRLVRIDPATNRIDARIPVGDAPLDVAVGFGSVWVANFADGTVSRVDPERGKVVATIKVGLTPEHLAVGEGGVWVIVRSR
jgi:serine/threonine protein kinase